MKRYLITTFCLVLIFPWVLAQETLQLPPRGISENQWKHFSKSWERQRINLIVFTVDSQEIEGQLLDFSENEIEIWPEKTFYHPNFGEEKIIKIPATNIYKLSFLQDKTFWQGAAAGGTVGGVVGGAWLLSQSDGVYIPYPIGGGVGMIFGGLVGGSIWGLLYNGTKVKREFFVDGKGFMITSYREDLEYLSIMSDPTRRHKSGPQINPENDKETLAELYKHSRRTRKLFARSNLHVAARAGFAYSPVQNQILNTLEGEGIPNEHEFRKLRAQTQLEVSLNIIPQLRIGATNFTKLATSTGKDDRTRNGSAYSFGTRLTGYGGFIEFIPKPLDPFFERRSELAVGIGYYRYELGVFSFLDDPDFIDGTWIPDDIGLEYGGGITTKSGIHFRLGYDYFINRYISFQLQAQAYLLKPLIVERRDFPSDIISEPIFLPEFKINPSSVNLSLGLRFHLPVK